MGTLKMLACARCPINEQPHKVDQMAAKGARKWGVCGHTFHNISCTFGHFSCEIGGCFFGTSKHPRDPARSPKERSECGRHHTKGTRYVVNSLAALLGASAAIWSATLFTTCEVGGAVSVPMALTPYGGWHREDKDSAESWTRRTHRRKCGVLRVRPTVRTSGANLGERDAPRFLICVRRSGDGERDVEVCPSEEQAGDEAGARYQRRGCAHEGDAATGGLAVAPHVHGDDMRWNPNDDGINFSP